MGTSEPARSRSSVGLLRTPIVAAVAACVLASLTGCGANFRAQTNTQYQPADGVSDRTSDIYAINTLVVADDDSNGTVVVSLINQAADADKLVSLTAEDSDGGGIKVAPLPSDGIELESQTAVDTAFDGTLRVNGESVTPGTLVVLTFGFQNAGQLRVEVPVVPQGTTYSEVPVATKRMSVVKDGADS